MQSLNNQSNISLRANAIYIGSWDDILKYQNIQVNLNADTNCEILYYTSNDKVLIESQSFTYNANDNYFNSINTTSRYVYFTVRNLQNINQNNFNFSVLYKEYPISSGGGVSENVTIVGPLNGDGSVRVGGSVDVGNFPTTQDVNVTNASVVVSGSVDVGNFPVTQDVNVTNTGFNCNNLPLSIVGGGVIITATDDIPVGGTILILSYGELQAINTNTSVTNTKIDATNTKLDTTNTNLTNTYNLLNTKGSSVLFNNVSSGVNGVSSAVNLSNIKISNMTFMGKSSGATLFTIQFSNDGVTYYDSQYSYNFSGAGSFGFNISGCPNYLRMKSSNDVVANAIINYC